MMCPIYLFLHFIVGGILQTVSSVLARCIRFVLFTLRILFGNRLRPGFQKLPISVECRYTQHNSRKHPRDREHRIKSRNCIHRLKREYERYPEQSEKARSEQRYYHTGYRVPHSTHRASEHLPHSVKKAGGKRK